MKLLAVLLVTAFSQSIWALTGTTCNCGRVNRGRVIGENETLVNEYPWMAALFIKHHGMISCGASIITPRHAITAAHCNDRGYVLLVGLHNLTRPESAMHVEIERIVSYPTYDPKSYENDIAVVITQHRIQFNSIVGPVCFPPGPMNLENQKIKALGWGRTHQVSEDSPRLLSADLTVMPYKQCLRYWHDLARPQSQLCQITRDPTVCMGDSSGSLVWLDPQTNRYTLVGVISYGAEGCSISKPMVSTAVGAFTRWINQMISETSEESICTKI